MNHKYYSNAEISKVVERINAELMRRSTYRWWDSLSTPTVGTDKHPPLSIPISRPTMEVVERVRVDDQTYTINNPSTGSIEPTRNISYPAHGDNPAGRRPDDLYKGDVPNTSAAEFNKDEMKNLLVGLSKIQDINLFYGRDEVEYIAFRDPKGIEEALISAENSRLNALLHESDISPTKNDPNGGITDRKNPDYPVDHQVTYPKRNGKYVMPSGEYDGEEMKSQTGLGPDNFYDDYGAEPGNANYHPMNRYISEQVRRDWHDQDNNRQDVHTFVVEGGKPSTRFGANPRNPQIGSEYREKPVYGGKQGSCNVACTGLCYMTCDNICSENCETTCWNRCGNSCTTACGNSCTSCSGQCMQSCRTKCENITGYSCVKAGAKTVHITTTGGKNGIPANNIINHTLYKCEGCSYSCQFYPNKKTECWDTGCMGKCFISCNTACSSSCYGGCIDNDPQPGNGYKSGKGRGCSSGCTLNCIGKCSGICAGFCISTCFNACKISCRDNCTWTCETTCGDGCKTGCTNGCTGCALTCSNGCRDKADSSTCTGCSSVGGCQTECMFDCNRNCMGKGCRSICGTESAGSCESNCRLSCMGSSCTAMCSDACSNMCTTCVDNCGHGCGMCVSLCSTGCESACNIYCTLVCSNNCSDNCVHSCHEECGGCSNLCFSCVGMCIGICSVKCTNGCSSCSNQCGWWCDQSCNRECMTDCSSYCINSCVGSCATYLMSDTTHTVGPDRPPTSDGYIYPHPKNRWEERESFKITKDIPQYVKPTENYSNQIVIADAPNRAFTIIEGRFDSVSERILRVLSVDEVNGLIHTNMTDINIKNVHNIWKSLNDGYFHVHLDNLYPGDFIYLWNIHAFGTFSQAPKDFMDDPNIFISSDTDVQYEIQQLSGTFAVWSIDENDNIVVDGKMLADVVHQVDITERNGIFVIKFLYPTYLNHEIKYILPFGLEHFQMEDKNHNRVVVIKRNEALYPSRARVDREVL